MQRESVHELIKNASDSYCTYMLKKGVNICINPIASQEKFELECALKYFKICEQNECDHLYSRPEYHMYSRWLSIFLL